MSGDNKRMGEIAKVVAVWKNGTLTASNALAIITEAMDARRAEDAHQL